MAFCSTCGAQIPDGVTTCPACTSRVPGGPAAAAVPAAGLTDNVAGMLAYVTFIPAIIFLDLKLPMISGWDVLDWVHSVGLKGESRIFVYSEIKDRLMSGVNK